MGYLLIAVIVYLVIGVLRVGVDFAQPIYNQPDYVRCGIPRRILSAILLWPFLVWMDIAWYLRRH
jgi:hypothetical protein